MSESLNILYISVFPIASAVQHDVYADVGHEFARRGHNLVVVSPLERRQKGKTCIIREGNETFLRVRTFNNQKVGAIEKMLALFTTPKRLERAINKHFTNERFDLIIYDTPFLKLSNPVSRLKRRFGAKSYLLLKDIWPKMLVDMGSMNEKSLLYCYFDRLIDKFYSVSDHIGCFSPGCLDYVKSRYRGPNPDKFEICPHSIMTVTDTAASNDHSKETTVQTLRTSLGVPASSVLFVYGGNFGVIQDVDFIMEALGSFDGDKRVFFALFGAGTEYNKLEEWAKNLSDSHSATGKSASVNIIVRPHLPKEDYITLLSVADAGLVFLNKRLTVPNIPSRTLDYLQMSLPIVAAIDASTDYGTIIEDGGFGLYSIAGDVNAFRANVEMLLNKDTRHEMGEIGRKFFENNWTAEKAADIILRHFRQ